MSHDHCYDCTLGSCHHLYCHDTVLVSSLKRRVRDLKDQLSRKELHMDLLRRKLSVQEEYAKAKCLALAERDEANCRARELNSQVDRLRSDLADSRMKIRCLNSDLADATTYKIAALERARKIDELQQRMMEIEAEKGHLGNQACQLKEQLKSTSDAFQHEKHVSEHTVQGLSEELQHTKANLLDTSRRESCLLNFKASVAKILGLVLPVPDVELLSRLQTLVDAHHDFTVVSKRYDDPALRMAARSPSPCFKHVESIDCEISKRKPCPYI